MSDKSAGRSQKLFGTLALTFGLFLQTQAQTLLTNGLVAYLPFNGNANDVTGNGNNGEVHGAQLAQDRFGNPNSAYAFNGLNTFILLTNSLQLPGDWTISAWARPSTLNQEGFILHIGTDDSTNITMLSRTANGFGVDFRSGDLIDVTSGVCFWGAYVLSDTNTWFQVVMRNGGGYSGMFLNGSGPSGAGCTPVNPVQGFIGAGSEKTLFFNGAVDDVRIYNRALTDSEIQQLYAYESGPSLKLIQAVKPSFSNLYLGTSYQLQVSGDMNTWTNQGSRFTATNSTMIYPQYWDTPNWDQLFFRLRIVP